MTDLYLVCLSHETPMYSLRVGAAAYDLTHLRAELADRDATVSWLKTLDVSYQSFVAPEMRRNYLSFIIGHPTCELEIQNDRGYRFHAIENAVTRPYNPLFAHKERAEYEATKGLLDQLRSSPTGRNIYDRRSTLNQQYLSTRRGGGDVYRNFGRNFAQEAVFANWDVASPPDPEYTYVQDVNAYERHSDFRVKAKSTSNHDLVLPYPRIDGFRLEENDLVLLTNQVNRQENGVYVIDSFYHLQPFRIARNTHEGRYRIMKGNRFANTTWVQLSQDPHHKNQQERNMQKPVGDCVEKIDLDNFTAEDLDLVMIENCLSLGTRRDIMNDLLKKQDNKVGRVVSVEELLDMEYENRKVRVNGVTRVLTDVAPPFDGDKFYILILDGRVIRVRPGSSLVVFPLEDG